MIWGRNSCARLRVACQVSGQPSFCGDSVVEKNYVEVVGCGCCENSAQNIAARSHGEGELGVGLR